MLVVAVARCAPRLEDRLAITYPLSFPQSQATPAQITLSAENVVAVGSSPFTFSEQSYVYSGQRWTASVTLPPMKRDFAEPWITFLMSLKGRQGYFLLSDPNAYEPQGLNDGDIRVNGGGQIGSTLTIDDMLPNLVGAFKAGDYLQIGEGASCRLHKIMNDVTSDALGSATVDIWPDLRESPGNNDRVWFRGASGLFRLASNITSWNINQISSYGISFDCVEYVW